MVRAEKTFFEWLWTSYWKSTLVPIIIIEIIFIGIYFGSNYWSTASNIETAKLSANDELTRIVTAETEEIAWQLSGVETATIAYRNQVATALSEPLLLSAEDRDRFGYSPDGVYYSLRDRKKADGAAVFYSGFVPVGEQERAKVARLTSTQRTMKTIKDSEALAVAVYFNSCDSLNIIYPYFDVLAQYSPKMDIPSFNFYYEADARHNPGKKPHWTDAYVDPAGNSWMVSCIAPVYSNTDTNFLEGVVGIDITLSTLVKYISELEIPWQGYALLVGREGAIIAMPKLAEADLNLKELTKFDYNKAITEEMFKPEQYNIYKRQDLKQLAKALQEQKQGSLEITLNNKKKLATWATENNSGWRTLVLVDEGGVFAPIYHLQADLFSIGYAMIGGLVLFNLIFFAFLFKLSKRHFAEIADKLSALQTIAKNIGDGDYERPVATMPIQEINVIAVTLQAMDYKIRDLLKSLGDSKKSTEALNQKLQETNAVLEATGVEAKAIALQAEAGNLMKSRFLANMSHEIRTPITGIVGFLELLRRSELSDEQQDYINDARTAAELLLYIINDILDISKIEAGKMTMEKVKFALRPVIYSAVAMLTPQAEEKKLKISVLITDSTPEEVIGDPSRLRQILNNIIGNAVKFTEHGEISVKVDCRIETGGIAALNFQITDSGIGISQEDINRLFQPFYQVDGSTTRKHGGTGLGLVIAKELTRLMDGEIAADSVVGEGSTFNVIVRLATDEQPDFTEYVINELNAVNILVVDADEQNLNTIAWCIKELGGQVFEAHDAATAITIIIEQAGTADKINIAIIDNQLPGMTGYELVTTLKTLSYAKDIKLILVGADVQPSEADHLLDKPLEKNALFRALAAVWGMPPNPKRLRKIEDSIGEFMLATEINEQDAREIFIEFRNYLPELLAKMTLALAQRDFEKLRKEVHQLKGSSGNMRVSSIYNLAVMLETVAGQQDQAECTRLLAELQETLE